MIWRRLSLALSFLPSLERKCITVWNKSASLFIIVNLAAEQSSKWSPPRHHMLPVERASVLAVFATAKSKDQSLPYYIQLASRPQALTSSKFSCLRKTACVWLEPHAQFRELVHNTSMPFSKAFLQEHLLCVLFWLCRAHVYRYIFALYVKFCHGIVLSLFDGICVYIKTKCKKRWSGKLHHGIQQE